MVQDKKESISHKLVYCIIYTMHRTGESIMILSEVMFISAWREPNKYRGWGRGWGRRCGPGGPPDNTSCPHHPRHQQGGRFLFCRRYFLRCKLSGATIVKVNNRITLPSTVEEYPGQADWLGLVVRLQRCSTAATFIM